MNVVFHPFAERELVAAALYLEQEAKLGNAFLDAYEEWEAHMKMFPESCPEVGAGVRKGIIQRYKYLIGYKIKGTGRAKHIRILYIRHYAQRRDDWGVRE